MRWTHDCVWCARVACEKPCSAALPPFLSFVTGGCKGFAFSSYIRSHAPHSQPSFLTGCFSESLSELGVPDCVRVLLLLRVEKIQAGKIQGWNILFTMRYTQVRAHIRVSQCDWLGMPWKHTHLNNANIHTDYATPAHPSRSTTPCGLHDTVVR